MSTASAPRFGAWLAAIVCAGALAMPGCNADSTPTGPTPNIPPPVVTTPPPTTTPTTPTPPSTPNGVVAVTVNPNPVPHDGTPVADSAGCANVRYTWYYDQVFRETGGAAVTFTNRIDLFDERETNNTSNLNIVVPANGTATVRSRWCSSTRTAHSAQTRWTGTDAAGRQVVVLGTKADLMTP